MHDERQRRGSARAPTARSHRQTSVSAAVVGRPDFPLTAGGDVVAPAAGRLNQAAIARPLNPLLDLLEADLVDIAERLLELTGGLRALPSADGPGDCACWRRSPAGSRSSWPPFRGAPRIASGSPYGPTGERACVEADSGGWLAPRPPTGCRGSAHMSVSSQKLESRSRWSCPTTPRSADQRTCVHDGIRIVWAGKAPGFAPVRPLQIRCSRA